MTELTVDLGYTPRAWQSECHLWLAKARFVVLALHRRAGKTELAILELVDHALRCDLHRPHYAYVAPYRNQAKAVCWERLKHYARKIPGTLVNESELWVKFDHNGARVQVFGADNADAMRGLRLDGAVVDEVANVKPEVWTEVMQPSLADRKGWALFIGTPHGINMFSDLYHKASTLPDWFSRSYTCYQTEALDMDEVERLRREMPEAEFAREMLCDFSAAAENQLMSVQMVEDACHRPKPRQDQFSFAARTLGVDVARFGDDRSVIVRRQGLVCYPPKVYSGLDNMALASLVAQEIQEWQPDAVFIDVGQGSGVVDRLRQLGHVVFEVNFGGKANNPKYKNKRTEMWFGIKEWIESGGTIPDVHELKQDLASPTYYFDPSNKVCLESKDEMKKRILRSPDCADALAVTFAFPVAPRAGIGLFAAKPNIQPDYDPFAPERL